MNRKATNAFVFRAESRRRVFGGSVALIFSALIFAASNATAFAFQNSAEAPREAHTATPRPNVLIVLADDMGWSDAGCFGSEIQTPTLDRLAANGLRFSRFYSTPRCCPSRASLNTGLYPHQAGIGAMDGRGERRGYEGFLTDRCVTIAQLLKKVGYRTYMSGKWHMSPVSGPIERGFDEYFGLLRGHSSDYFDPSAHVRLPSGRPMRQYKENEYYATDVFTDYALDFLADSRRLDADGARPPFFLYLAYTAPHFPLQAPSEDVAKYSDVYFRGWDEIRRARFERQKTLGLVDETLVFPARSDVPANWVSDQTGWSEKENPAWASIEPDRQRDLARRMAIFAASIDRMDRNLGRIIDDLQANGDLENTLIFFLSDNGACAEWDPWGFDESSGPKNVLHRGAELDEMGGPGTYSSVGSGWANVSNSPFRLYKHYIQEGGISVPFIAHWPAGISRKNEIEKSVAHEIDVLPTILELAGASYPETWEGKPIIPAQGRSLTPQFRGEMPSLRTLFWEHEDNRGVLDEPWKLVWVNSRRKWELYNVEEDRFESNDLAQARPDLVELLAEKWQTWTDAAFVTSPEPGEPAPDRTPGTKLLLEMKPDVAMIEDATAFRQQFAAIGKFAQDDRQNGGAKSGEDSAIRPENESENLPSTSSGLFFDGASRLEFSRTSALHCARTDWTIDVVFEATAKDGVVLSCGGERNGWALTLRDGVARFVVVSGRRETRISADRPVSGRARVVCVLNRDRTAAIYLNGDKVGEGAVPDLIDRLPLDPLQIGADVGGQVDSSNLPPFHGTIERVELLRGAFAPTK